MGQLSRLKNFFTSGNFLFNKWFGATLWFGLSIFTIIQNLVNHSLNNFIIFRYSYFHTLEKANLYLSYPQQYEDVFLYGPVFSIFIAPFALMPVWLGTACWVLLNTAFLYYAIRQLPISIQWKNALILFCAHEMMNHSSWLQTNAIICGCIILAYVFVNKEKDIWALLFIVLATFIKLYGVVGLAFFLFSKQKGKFILWGLCWSLICFFAPLLITDFSFLTQCYHDWYIALTTKAAKNIDLSNLNYFQDISIMGIIRRVFYTNLNDAFVLIPGALLMLSQFIYLRFYKDLRYQLYLLASILIFTVIFSTGSESPTYIIALPGICIWYILQRKNKAINSFFIFALLFTTLCYSDIFTTAVRRQIVMRYSLKAVFPSIIWIIILIQIHTKQFLKISDPLEDNRIPQSV